MILLDYRVGSKDLLEDLKRLVNCPVELEKLTAGDVVFTGCGPDDKEVMIGIELKTISEFLSSMRTGRVAEQVGRMYDAYEYNYLVVQGIWRPSEHGVIEVPHREKGVMVWSPLAPISKAQMRKGQKRHVSYTFHEMEKHIMSLETKRGLFVKHARSRHELLLLLTTVIHAWWQKPWDSHTSVDAIKLQPTGVRYSRASTLRLMASQIPGVGALKAKLVDKQFMTVERMIMASPEDWAQIDGIGKKLSLSIYESLRGDKNDGSK